MPDLTQDEVFAACEEIARRDGSVTGHAVHKLLARGSKSTVQKHTMAWQDRRNVGMSVTLSITSALTTIESMMTSLIEQARGEERELARRREAQRVEELARTADAVVSAVRDRDAALKDRDDAIAAREDALARVVALDRELHRTEGRRQATEDQRDRAQREVSDLRTLSGRSFS